MWHAEWPLLAAILLFQLHFLNLPFLHWDSDPTEPMAIFYTHSHFLVSGYTVLCLEYLHDRYSVKWFWCLRQSQLYSSHSSNNLERPTIIASITLNCNELLHVFPQLYWEFLEGKDHVWFCSLLIPLHLAQIWYTVEAKKCISWMKEMNNKWKYKQTNEWEKGLISLFNAGYRVWYSPNLVYA